MLIKTTTPAGFYSWTAVHSTLDHRESSSLKRMQWLKHNFYFDLQSVDIFSEIQHLAVF